MRAVFTLTVVLAALPATRADEITLADGRRLPGTLTLDANGRLRVSAADGSVIPAHRVRHVRPDSHRPAPFRAGVVHQVLLPGEQRLSGELLSLDGQELRLLTPWRDRLAVPRAVLRGVMSLPGRLLICDDDFENGLKAWKLTGTPRLTDGLYTSGSHGLLLDAPGQSAAYALAAPLPAGGVAVNFHVPEALAGARWQVEADFGRSLRVTVADEAGDYAVEASAPRDEGAAVARSPGWHRLAVEFAAETLLVTMDDAVLWYSRGKGPGGPLREVRLACVADKGTTRGAVAFDEFTVTRAVERLRRPPDTSAQDEIWLASGDQLFGRLTRLDRHGLDLEARFGKRSYSWAEVRGAFPKGPVAPPATTEGAHVRVRLRPAAGDEPDELEGVLRALDERRLVLRHPALGELDIDRARLLRVEPLFHGRRIELENGTRHLGERGRTEKGVQPAQAEGPTAEYRLRLDAQPSTARLVLAVRPIEGHSEVVVNDRFRAELDRYVGRRAGAAVRVSIPLPRDALRAGENTVAVRVRDEAGRRGSCLLSEVVLEMPE